MEATIAALTAAHAKALEDVKRMDLLERIVRWSDPANTAKIVFEVPTVPHCTLRSVADAALAAAGPAAGGAK